VLAIIFLEHFLLRIWPNFKDVCNRNSEFDAGASYRPHIISHMFAGTRSGHGSDHWHSIFTPTVIAALSGVQSVSLFLQVRRWLASGFRYDRWEVNVPGPGPAWNDLVHVYGFTRLRLFLNLCHVNVALYARPDASFHGKRGWIYEPVTANDREAYVRSFQELLCTPWDDVWQSSFEKFEMREFLNRIPWNTMMRYRDDPNKKDRHMYDFL